MRNAGVAAGRGRRSSNSGVASIEFVIVFPVLLLLFFGLVNFAHYISTVQKISGAAVLVADLVTRSAGALTNANFDDYFTAVELAIRPLPAAGVKVDIYDFYLSGSTATRRWKKSNSLPAGAGAPTCAEPDTASDPIRSLLSADTDVVVAVVCMGYIAPVPDFPGLAQLFSNITIRRSMALRPRQLQQVTCQDCP